MTHRKTFAIFAITVITAILVMAAAVPASAQTPTVTPISDDFNRCTLAGFWTTAGLGSVELVNPWTADASLQINVPAGAKHTLSNENTDAPRVMQPAQDVDFTLEAKFMGVMDTRWRMQGILVQQDANRWVRFEFHSDNTNIYAYMASFNSANPTPFHDYTSTKVVAAPLGTVPLYLRVTRTAPTWKLEFSTNGTTWVTAYDGITEALTVSQVGIYAGNSTSTTVMPPAFTGIVDYFQNSADPITGEDAGTNSINVTKVGQGTVTKSPDKATYTCGETVTLTAAPAANWNFTGWSGDAVSTNKVITVNMQGPTDLTATFSAADVTLDKPIFLPFVRR